MSTESAGPRISAWRLWRRNGLIWAALLVVTGGKTFLNWLLMMLVGEKFLVALETSLFLSPVGEFSFVIAGAGLTVGALSPEGHKLAIAVIAMSLLSTPLWFISARLFHRVALGRLRIMGLDLAEYRLWHPAAQAPQGPGE